MKNRPNISLIVLVSAIITLLSLTLVACSKSSPSPTPTPTTSPGGNTVVQSDSIISGKIKAIRQVTTGYPWQVDVLIESSQNVGTLPNPTKDKVGQVVTAVTDEDLSLFKAEQEITARVKYTGDVPRPGIFLYIYNIKAN